MGVSTGSFFLHAEKCAGGSVQKSGVTTCRGEGGGLQGSAAARCLRRWRQDEGRPAVSPQPTALVQRKEGGDDAASRLMAAQEGRVRRSSLVEAQLALRDARGGIGRSQLRRAGASPGVCLS